MAVDASDDDAPIEEMAPSAHLTTGATEVSRREPISIPPPHELHLISTQHVVCQAQPPSLTGQSSTAKPDRTRLLLMRS
jgi:hypothetical protein